MLTAIIVEYSNPLNISVVKVIHGYSVNQIYVEFYHLINMHLKSCPDVYHDIEKHEFRVSPGFDESNYPMLPLQTSDRVSTDVNIASKPDKYIDHTGKWKLIILEP